MKIALTLSLSLFLFTLSYAQNSPCFKRYFKAGKIAYDSLDFENAKAQFEAAIICEGITQTQLDSGRAWLDRTNDGYINAIKKERDLAQQRLEENRDLQQRLSIQRKREIKSNLFDLARSYKDLKKYVEEKEIYLRLKDTLYVWQLEDIRIDLAQLDTLLYNCEKKLELKREFDQFISIADSLKNNGGYDYIKAYQFYKKADSLNYNNTLCKERCLNIFSIVENCCESNCEFSCQRESTLFMLANLYLYESNLNKIDEQLKDVLDYNPFFEPSNNIHPDVIQRYYYLKNRKFFFSFGYNSLLSTLNSKIDFTYGDYISGNNSLFKSVFNSSVDLFLEFAIGNKTTELFLRIGVNNKGIDNLYTPVENRLGDLDEFLLNFRSIENSIEIDYTNSFLGGIRKTFPLFNIHKQKPIYAPFYFLSLSIGSRNTLLSYSSAIGLDEVGISQQNGSLIILFDESASFTTFLGQINTGISLIIGDHLNFSAGAGFNFSQIPNFSITQDDKIAYFTFESIPYSSPFFGATQTIVLPDPYKKDLTISFTDTVDFFISFGARILF